ncbi:putative NtrC family transcriptional regulator [Candidatus Zixiibacteriota bacterium]|nr:putative NtrC family transcriptional regulator [candidate division Zixibacteria bacterium]
MHRKIAEKLDQQLSEIDALIRARKFSEAQEKIDIVHHVEINQKEYAYFCLLKSELALFRGDIDIQKELDHAIDYYRPSSDNEKFAQAKFLKGWFLIVTGRPKDAREELLESYIGFKRADNMEGQARALNRLAFLAQNEGEMDLAVEYLGKCANLYLSAGLNDRAHIFSNNLALILFLSGRIKEALEQFRSNLDRLRIMGQDYQLRHHLRYGLALAFKGELEESFVQIDAARLLTEGFKREEAIYYEYYGWMNCLSGNYVMAEKKLIVGLGVSSAMGSVTDHISQTKRLLADAYLGLGKFELAQKYAEEALTVAEKINERAEIAACYRVFARTALNDGDKEKSRQWFGKAIDLFAMITSRYELAVTRYLAALSGLYQNGERSAMLYLAKEYFEAEEIRPYIDKVNAALGPAVRPKPTVRDGEPIPVFIAECPGSRKIREMAENVAACDMTVLLTGPTGSGKDQLARYIHWYSGRTGELVTVNCAAIPETMAEAELFGVMRGAYTGADKDKPGLFEMADGGTIYLNEIAETAPSFQAKLLEIIESKTVRRLGSTEPKRINFRIIAATNQNLEETMRNGKFRVDLYHRLNEIPILLPPLAERADDIAALARYFLVEAGFDFEHNGNRDDFDAFCALLSRRDWPGNIRELRSEIRRLYQYCGNSLGDMAQLLSVTIPTPEEILMKALEEAEGNQSEAARRLGISESGFRYRLKKSGLS